MEHPLKFSAWPSEVEAIQRAIVATTVGEYVIEVGCYRGVTSAALAVVSPRLVCIDPWDGAQDESGEEDFRAFIDNTARHGNIIIHRERSQDVDVSPYFGKTRAVFIDGQHDYASVLQDICKFEALLVPGGTIFVHDVLDEVWGDGVMRAIETYLQGEKRKFTIEGYFPSHDEESERCHGVSGLAWWTR